MPRRSKTCSAYCKFVNALSLSSALKHLTCQSQLAGDIVPINLRHEATSTACRYLVGKGCSLTSFARCVSRFRAAARIALCTGNN